MCSLKSRLDYSVIFSLKTYVFLISFVYIAEVSGFSGKQFSDRLFWLEHIKQIAFPKGISFTFTSAAQIPLWTAFNEAVSSNIEIEVPIQIKLDTLTQRMVTPRRKVTFPYHPSSTLDNNIRYKREIGNETLVEENYCTLGQQQRLAILKKLENILNSVGVPGGPCLLRAICEFHEFYAFDSYGFLGEMTKLLFSVKDKNSNCQNEFIKAEEMGRGFRCVEYYKTCGKSLFKWKTKYLPYFSTIF